jgi:hypothetical protein
MQHYIFFIINLIILGSILFIDRKRLNDYYWIIGIGLLFAYVFETITTYLGFWQYHSLPLIPLISLYTWLLYATYLSLIYFIANMFMKVKDGH